MVIMYRYYSAFIAAKVIVLDDSRITADPSNKKCAKFFTKEIDGLAQSWQGYNCYVNPPYGPGMVKWLAKALSESETGKTIAVCLIPARTNTNWWHDICMKAAEIRFIRGRPKFIGATHGLPQPLALIIFKKHTQTNPILSTFEMGG